MSLSVLVRRRPKIFYGWWMVTLSSFVSSVNKTAVNKGFPVFILPVEEYFGASRATVSFIFALARSENGPTGPFAGWLVDRFGPRAMIFVGATMSGGGFLLLGQTGSIWAFALIYLGVVNVGSNLGFSYPMSTLINNWFYRQKAMAMSAFHAMDSLLPALLVPLLYIGIRDLGLPVTFNIIGIVILSVVLPLAFFIKNTPEGRGLTMDGDPPATAQTQTGFDQRGQSSWTPPADYGLKSAMRTPTYWVLVTGTAFRLVAKAAVMLHVIPIFISKGIDEQTAVLVFSLLLFITLPLYLIVGWLADRFPKNWVLTATAVSGTASFALMASPLSSLWVVLLFVALFSVAEASAPTNWAALGEYFGRKTFGQLRGFVQFANFPFVLMAPVFVGWWFDGHGNYTVPLWIFTAVFAFSALTFGVMRRPPSEEPGPADEPMLEQSSPA
ncbi:MAG: MFS transporter [Chloroflexi bacterium]|nr:MFS transporter [Chloroflexota bacterium]MDA1219766.1 MFS transporter [Chloroflexota bacterium]